MAATFAARAAGEGFNPQKIPGGYFDVIVEITADAAYAAGGYAFGITQLQNLFGGAPSIIEQVLVVNHWSAAAGTTAFLAVFDNTNKKVQAFGMAAAAGVGTGFTESSANNAALNGLKAALWVRFR